MLKYDVHASRSTVLGTYSTMILHTDGIHDKNKLIYASNKNTHGLGYGYGGFLDSVDMGILWGLPQVFCGCGMGMGIKIQSQRQPCNNG